MRHRRIEVGSARGAFDVYGGRRDEHFKGFGARLDGRAEHVDRDGQAAAAARFEDVEAGLTLGTTNPRRVWCFGFIGHGCPYCNCSSLNDLGREFNSGSAQRFGCISQKIRSMHLSSARW